jgi:arylsulfatase A-like enzyme
MKYTPFFTWMLCGWLALAMVGCGGNEQKPLNIVFIMTDDHAVQAISAYDSTHVRTPNLDRLAAEGLLFTRAFVSNSICAPSRATMLTGTFNHINGQVDNSTTFDGSQQTFPKLLQAAGYQTALVGKWHLRSDPTGFDYWNILPGQGDYYNPDFIEMGQRSRREGYVTDLITDYSTDWLDKRDPARPFCLLVHHKAPHRTWMPDTSHLDLYDSTTFVYPSNFNDTYENRQAAAAQKMHIDDLWPDYDLKMVDEAGEIAGQHRQAIENMIDRMNPAQRAAWDREYQPIIRDYQAAGLTGQALREWKYQRYMTDYLRCIASVDENIGRLMDYLEAEGLLENTLIVYTSDQGFYLGEHGWFDKRFMYEESFRTPLIIRAPGRSANGHKERRLVQNIDFAPTFLDYAQVPVPPDMQGLSMRPILDEEALVSWRNSLYYHYYEFPNEHRVKRHYGIRTERFKLIHFYNDIDQWELYDLTEDPQEMHNLYGQPAWHLIADSLKVQLTRLQVAYGDTVQATY